MSSGVFNLSQGYAIVTRVIRIRITLIRNRTRSCLHSCAITTVYLNRVAFLLASVFSYVADSKVPIIVEIFRRIGFKVFLNVVFFEPRGGRIH